MIFALIFIPLMGAIALFFCRKYYVGGFKRGYDQGFEDGYKMGTKQINEDFFISSCKNFIKRKKKEQKR